MIWFDNHRVFGSANYYVQKLFMNNLPTYLLETEKEGLDSRRVIGPETIGGGLEITADRCSARFYDIKVTDIEIGACIPCVDMALENESREIGSIDSRHYTVEFTAVRNYGDLGFKLAFAVRGERDRIVWSIGGWQNQDCCIDKFEGHASCLTQSRFSVETGVEYKLKLENT